PHFTRFDVNAPSHTTKCTASRIGTSHNFLRSTSSPMPQIPTVQAAVSLRTRYAVRYPADINAVGATTAAATAHGSPWVTIKPKKEAGRSSLFVLAHRTWCSQNSRRLSAGYIVQTGSRESNTLPPALC